MAFTGAIPNPTKTITLKGNEDEVNRLLRKVCPYLNENIKSGYYEIKLDETLGKLEIGKTEFLSLGARIIIETNYKTEDSTEINFEIQRQVGAFDQTYEISYANEHLSNAVEAIKYLSKNPNYIVRYIESTTSEPNVSNSASNTPIIAIWVVALFLWFLWYLVK
jgi:hypothetical protein